MNISNSMLNAYSDYKDEKLCGLQFEAVYVKKTHETVKTESMANGQWFEYMCTGVLPRDGVVPTGPTLKNGNLSTDGERIASQVNHFKKLYKDRTYLPSVEMIHELNGHTFKSIFDVLEFPGDVDFLKLNDNLHKAKAIRDIKLTAVIDDKWNDFGWVNIQFKKHINQAKFYIWIYWKKYGRILPFYFDVFSSKTWQFKVFRVTMTETSVREFEVYLLEAADMITFDIETGFIAYPDLMPCHNCPVGYECPRYTDMPTIEEVNI